MIVPNLALGGKFSTPVRLGRRRRGVIPAKLLDKQLISCVKYHKNKTDLSACGG